MCKSNDRSRPSKSSDRSSGVLSSITENAGLFDSGLSGPASCSYTRIQRNLHARVDHVYVSSAFLTRRVSCCVQSVSFSDHSMVIVSIGECTRRKFQPCWALWKLSATPIGDRRFKADVNVAFLSCFSMRMHLHAAWECLSRRCEV